MTPGKVDPKTYELVGGGFLCVGCIESRLGRRLTINDFNPIVFPFSRTSLAYRAAALARPVSNPGRRRCSQAERTNQVDRRVRRRRPRDDDEAQDRDARDLSSYAAP